MGDKPPFLSGLNLAIKDMGASLAFYRRLGLVIPEESVWSKNGTGHHVAVKMPDGFTLNLDSVALKRAYDSVWGEPSGPSRNELVFLVPSREAVDVRYADMTSAGYVGHLAPFDAFWGARTAIIYDPDGNQVALMSPIDPQHRWPAPL